MLPYLFMTSKVLQSLIMTIFAQEHAKTFKRSEKMYIFAEHCMLFEYHRCHLKLPPPLNLPWIIWYLLPSRRASEKRAAMKAIQRIAPLDASKQAKSNDVSPYVNQYVNANKQANEKLENEKRQGNILQKMQTGTTEISLEVLDLSKRLEEQGKMLRLLTPTAGHRARTTVPAAEGEGVGE